jgi:hypothetical protein
VCCRLRVSRGANARHNCCRDARSHVLVIVVKRVFICSGSTWSFYPSSLIDYLVGLALGVNKGAGCFRCHVSVALARLALTCFCFPTHARTHARTRFQIVSQAASSSLPPPVCTPQRQLTFHQLPSFMRGGRCGSSRAGNHTLPSCSAIIINLRQRCFLVSLDLLCLLRLTAISTMR